MTLPGIVTIFFIYSRILNVIYNVTGMRKEVFSPFEWQIEQIPKFIGDFI